MALIFSDTSENGSGSVKVFTCSGTKQELIDSGVPARFSNSPNNMFIAQCSDGSGLFEVNEDATGLSNITDSVEPYYEKSPIYSEIINTDDWSQGVTFSEASLDAGEYVISLGIEAQFLALQYVVEWRVSGAITEGPYTEGGLAVVATIAKTVTYPIDHAGGPITLNLQARIPALGFDVPLEKLFITLDRKKAGPFTG